jgi:hypothetical protein
MMKWVLRIVIVSLVCVLPALAVPVSGALTPPTLTVTPDTALVGGQFVTVDGAGYTPDSRLVICELPTAGNICGQDPAPIVTTDATGTFSTQFEVFRFISAGESDCAQPTVSCSIGAEVFNPTGTFVAKVPIDLTPQTPTTTLMINGSVTRPNGQPITGVKVWGYISSDTWLGSFQTVTDTAGSYQLATTWDPNAMQNRYKIVFIPPASTGLNTQWYIAAPNRTDAQWVQIPNQFNDPVIDRIDAQLRAGGGAITGVVTDPQRAGVAGVVVMAYAKTDTWVYSYRTTTAANGTYRLGPILKYQSYKIVFKPPSTSGLATEWYDNKTGRLTGQWVAVTSNVTVTGIDAQLNPTP